MATNTESIRQAEERQQLAEWKKSKREMLIVSLLFFAGAAAVLWLMFQ